MNSMSLSGSPARSAIAIPSPVQAYAFVVARYRRPAPPVARIVADAGHRLDAAVEQVPADDAHAPAVVLDEPEREVLLEDDEAFFHPLLQLLVEHLDEDVTGDVRRVDGARRAGGAEGALVELALRVP